MSKFEQPPEEKSEIHLETINQSLTPEELEDFLSQLPERIKHTKDQIKKAEEAVSQGGLKIGPVVIRTPSVDNAELSLPILKQDLEILEKAQVEALEKKQVG